jgi:hypothetical protein
MSSITTAITGQQPQGFAEGGMSSKIEDLLDEYKKFKMRKDQGRMGYADGSPAGPIPLGISRLYRGLLWEGAFNE